MEFKIGDRVKCLRPTDVKKEIVGKYGTVIDVRGSNISVEFDECIKGHDCSGIGKGGHCWNCELDTIEKIVKETKLGNKQSIKMTIDEFKKDSRHIAIHCKTKEEIDKIIESMPKLDIPISTNWTGYNNKKGVLIYNSWGEFGGAHWDFPNSHSAQQIYEFEEIDFKEKTKMEKLEDITLQKGDIITLKDGTITVVLKDDVCLRSLPITKIERPTSYETIYEAPKDILDKEEKEYLSAVIKPFRNKVKCIEKVHIAACKEFISIRINTDGIILPYFKEDAMYKGMEINRGYTLEELGL